jgi:hypothetical protein
MNDREIDVHRSEEGGLLFPEIFRVEIGAPSAHHDELVQLVLPQGVEGFQEDVLVVGKIRQEGSLSPSVVWRAIPPVRFRWGGTP